MNNEIQVLDGLKQLLLLAVALNLLLYWGVVCVKLYRHGARLPTGLLPWRYFHDLQGYRQVLAAEGKSSNGYFILLVLTWFTLLLAVGVGLYTLNVRSQALPTGRLPY